MGRSCTFHKAIERINPKSHKCNTNSLRDTFQSSMQAMSSSFCLLGQPPSGNGHNFRFGVRLGHSSTFHKAIERISPKSHKYNSKSLRDAFQSSMQACLPRSAYRVSYVVKMAIAFLFGVLELSIKLSNGQIRKATSPSPIDCAWPSKVQRNSCLHSLAYWINHLVKTAITFAFGVRLGHSWTIHQAIEWITRRSHKSKSKSLCIAFQSSTQAMSPFFGLLDQPPGENGRNFRIWCTFGTLLDYSSSCRMEKSKKP